MRGDEQVTLKHVTYVEAKLVGLRVWCETCDAEDSIEVNAIGAHALIEWVTRFLVAHELER